uniref:NADH-ubiquinone oxidoreductase subunit 4L n=1 Tax=Ulva sp. TM708 TaxID=2496873 RepID=A0A7R6SBQ8_9CHLO|nr:NADH-ubiquinone oxidoreductase subunit 4L [Ulva sp. TM708]AZP40135.1 NADH-ubiquinone oxidoreductase subunit 4L [Ulva sp. TM708]
MPSVIEADLSELSLLWQPNTFPGSDTFNQLIVTGLIVFWIGLTGIFFNRRLVISILLAVELTLLSINLLMLTFAAAMEDLVGVMFALYILCVAAAESAIGLALIIIWYRVRRTVSVQYISLLKG